ncbi:DJ-1/PfpI family protein [Desulfoluna spongiiphila]|uniref:DJ-1/PfpI family protein n=1 Tax=Desulfoluna spongiiphila TaxID=419481 RepID=UPI0012527A33|nr:DJ-1/PfpI family protein [Desulfoluna spongiiphila]VVS91381.1 dj-1/pfpi [Desulfoluna spongiiphila]
MDKDRRKALKTIGGGAAALGFLGSVAVTNAVAGEQVESTERVLSKGKSMTKGLTYGMLIYEQVAELDFVGPQQVFAASNSQLGGGRIVTIAPKIKPLRGVAGLRMIPDYCIEDAPKLDVLLVPGTAEVSKYALGDDKVIRWVRDQYNKVDYMTAVCTGALILQKAGLLKGRKATTHWMLMDSLAKDPMVTEMPEMRYVRDGKVITSQGVSAGFDMALWLVGEIYTPEHARKIRKILQYDPAPPYSAEV